MRDSTMVVLCACGTVPLWPWHGGLPERHALCGLWTTCTAHTGKPISQTTWLWFHVGAAATYVRSSAARPNRHPWPWRHDIYSPTCIHTAHRIVGGLPFLFLEKAHVQPILDTFCIRFNPFRSGHSHVFGWLFCSCPFRSSQPSGPTYLLRASHFLSYFEPILPNRTMLQPN
jgi:hypothetical protein